MTGRQAAVRQREDEWLVRIDPTRLPRHLAIIMDGNGRWATERHMPRAVGHVRGAKTVRDIVDACRHLPARLREAGVPDRPGAGRIECLTLYTFSNENWRRPRGEVWGLMQLIEGQLRDHLAEMQANQVSVRLLGRYDALPESLREELTRDIEATSDNRAMSLYLALNYGGRREIADAARRLAERVRDGEIAPQQIDEELFAQHLYAPGVPDPELLIRTGGDLRVSNFLLWQIAYAEIWVTPTYWPAFAPADVYRAIAEFQQRDRRFGGLNTNGSA